MGKYNACLCALFFATISVIFFTSCKNESANGSWKDYGGGPDQSKYVVAEDINKNTVGQLEVAWSYPTGDGRIYQWNPVIIDTIMYVLAKNSSLVALNVKTGKEIWIHSNLRGITGRGINYWESKDRKDRR
ncbi:MAG: PQQ-binding-like beta-propeller repeat protein, partial [Bacteroidia bacterium]|nr:PQQ-binding-like beta-propeller repeat protein [Bacteroidia bacterium]